MNLIECITLKESLVTEIFDAEEVVFLFLFISHAGLESLVSSLGLEIIVFLLQ